MIFIVLILIMTLIGSLGAICLKISSQKEKGLFELLFQPMFILGGTLYVISALINLALLKKYEYTIVFPLTTLTYAWTILVAFIVLNEKITVMKMMAILLIVIGAICIVTF